jgi:hypothetical protein
LGIDFQISILIGVISKTGIFKSPFTSGLSIFGVLTYPFIFKSIPPFFFFFSSELELEDYFIFSSFFKFESNKNISDRK